VLPTQSTDPPAGQISEHQLTRSEQRLLASGLYSLQDIQARRSKRQKALTAGGTLPAAPSKKQPAAARHSTAQHDAAGTLPSVPKQRNSGTPSNMQTPKAAAAPLSAQHDTAQHDAAARSAAPHAAFLEDPQMQLTPSQKRLLAAGYTLEQLLDKEQRKPHRSSSSSLADSLNWQGTSTAPADKVKGRKQSQQGGTEGRQVPYVGWGAPLPQRVARFALRAAASATEGPAPDYAWPKEAPVVLPPQLHIGEGGGGWHGA
jgi:hypothetical protein